MHVDGLVGYGHRSAIDFGGHIETWKNKDDVSHPCVGGGDGHLKRVITAFAVFIDTVRTEKGCAHFTLALIAYEAIEAYAVTIVAAATILTVYVIAFIAARTEDQGQKEKKRS